VDIKRELFVREMMSRRNMLESGNVDKRSCHQCDECSIVQKCAVHWFEWSGKVAWSSVYLRD